jgi:DNA uptake protein ComE-like DNA-binding protein
MRDRGNGHPGQNAGGEVQHKRRIIDLNTASKQDLTKLPQVGPGRARAIIQNRPFRSWNEVARLSGFGDRLVRQLESGGARIGEPNE